jgi:Zn-dependent protease with chaperone function
MAERKIVKGERIVLSGISSKAWEHPADRAALNALRAVPGVDQVIKFIIGNGLERMYRLRFLGTSVKASEKQYPKVYGSLVETARILDSEYVPEIYVTSNPTLNAMAFGVDNPFIIINSELARKFDEDELMTVVAHEMGHILSGHMLYKTMAIIIRMILVNLSLPILRAIPFSYAILYAVSLALLEWSRKSELSCDRVGLLTVQNPEASYRVLTKLAGGVDEEQLNVEEFIKQAEEYEGHGNIVDGVMKLMILLDQTHPFPVLRVKELKNWIDDSKYQEILDGNYHRRDEEDEWSFKGDFESAYNQYKEDLKRSEDPLAKTLNNLGENLQEGVEKAAKQAEEFFSNLFK